MIPDSEERREPACSEDEERVMASRKSDSPHFTVLQDDWLSRVAQGRRSCGGTMSLKIRFVLLFLVTVGLIVGVGYGVQWFNLGRRLSAAEADIARKEIVHCADEIGAQVSLLNAICSDWAVRPDTSLFVQARDDADSEPILSRSPFAESTLDLVFILNARGEVRYSRTVDVTTREVISFREFPTTSWPLSHRLLAPIAEGSSASGVFLTGQGPALVSSHPIPTARESGGAPVGVLVIGRVLDNDFISRIGAKTRTAFQLWPVTDITIPQKARTFLETNPDINRPYVDDISSDIVRVFVTYPDIFGNAALLLSADIPTGIIGEGLASMQRTLLLQLGIGLAAFVAMIFLVRRNVTDPISRLADYCRAVVDTRNPPARLSLKHNDEIGALATELDRMVEQFREEAKSYRQTEEAFRESEERLSLALEGASVGVWDWNLNTDKINFSSQWNAMIGYDEGESVGTRDDWFNRINPEDLPGFEAAFETHMKGQSEEFKIEHRIKHQDGTERWVLCRGLAIRKKKGKPTRLIGTQMDITRQKLGEKQLAHDAFHDVLTGLPNRSLFLDRLEAEIIRLERNKNYRFGILFVDLDRFKVINDGLGHAVGDVLLKSIADKLASRIRATDTVGRCEETVARFGGDEFVVLLEDIHDVRDAIRVTDRILQVVSEPLTIEGHEVFTTASVGIALGGARDASANELLRHADTAMYRAKAEGGACYAIFDTSMGIRAKKRLQMETHLRRAVENSELMVYYQPIVSLEKGKIDSLEALIRWHHPELGTVAPEELIRVAEETGMIKRVGQHVLKTACGQARAWQISHPQYSELGLSVNLSVKEISGPNIVELVQQCLSESDFDPRHLKIEVTESTIMSNFELVSNTIHNLKSMNIQLSIDDFGTGYSSLSYLHKVAVDILKIDLSFVANVHTSPESLQLVKTIVALAKNLQLVLVAEGIENKNQLDLLRDLGCDYGQGYFFSPALDAEGMTVLLESDPTW